MDKLLYLQARNNYALKKHNALNKNPEARTSTKINATIRPKGGYFL